MSRSIATTVTLTAVAAILLTATVAGGASSPGQAPPTNLTLPSISGTAQQGQTLTASTGTWSGKSLSYSSQWFRCDSTGAACSAIAGATSSTYALSSADVGHTLRIMVTASNRNGSAAATSAATAVVTATGVAPPDSSWTLCANEYARCSFSDTEEVVYGANGKFTSPRQFTGGVDCDNAVFGDPAPGVAKACFRRLPAAPASTPPSSTSLPSISGTAQQGQTLSASNGSWSGTTPLSYAYQWQRCNSSGGSCAAVGGATGSSDLLGSGDVGFTMRVSVTASNSAGSATASSAATAVVTAATVAAPDSSWTFCANEGGRCSFSDTREVVYGASGKFTSPRQFTGGVDCNNTVFADPAPGVAKACFQRLPAAPAPAPTGVIADEGTIRLGNSPTSMTNASKFANLATGGYLNLFQPLPGNVVQYSDEMWCMDGDPIVPSIATCRANGWLLHNSSGQEIIPNSWQYYDNPGNSGFQNTIKQNILNYLAANPWMDGIYFDDFFMDVCALPNLSYPVYDASNRLLWSNNADYQASQISFITSIGDALKARGYKVAVNAKGYVCSDGGNTNNGTNSKLWIDQYAPHVTAATVELWQQNEGNHSVFLSGGQDWMHQWDAWQSVVSHAQSKGLEFWPLVYIAKSGEDAQCRYLRGSYLLEWNGKGSIMLAGWQGSDFWNTCTATNVGLPSGAKYQVATGVWRRDFTGGYVIVNPTASTVTVGGATIPPGDAILHQN